MEEAEIEIQIKQLEEKLRKRASFFSDQECRRLYELTGKLMELKHGVSLSHNPCSIEAVSKVVLKMAELIKPSRLLNVGTGGYPLLDIELARRGFKVTGIEYALSLASLARRAGQASGQSLSVLAADGQKLPFQNRSFEACLCSETLEHIPDDKSVVAEIHRVLKPGGWFLMTVPNTLPLLGLGRRIAGLIADRPWIDHPNHLREYTFLSAIRLVEKHFSIVRFLPVPFTSSKFGEQPYEYCLSKAVGFPGLSLFSLSHAFLLKRKDL